MTDAHHEGDGGVEGHGVPELVLEDVEVVEPVGVAVGGVLQAELVGVLGDPVDVVRVVEGEVHRHGLRTMMFDSFITTYLEHKGESAKFLWLIYR